MCALELKHVPGSYWSKSPVTDKSMYSKVPPQLYTRNTKGYLSGKLSSGMQGYQSCPLSGGCASKFWAKTIITDLVPCPPRSPQTYLWIRSVFCSSNHLQIPRLDIACTISLIYICTFYRRRSLEWSTRTRGRSTLRGLSNQKYYPSPTSKKRRIYLPVSPYTHFF